VSFWIGFFNFFNFFFIGEKIVSALISTKRVSPDYKKTGVLLWRLRYMFYLFRYHTSNDFEAPYHAEGILDVGFGYNISKTLGRSIVVHDAAGNRISCVTSIEYFLFLF
jgi:hypothetical protein